MKREFNTYYKDGDKTIEFYHTFYLSDDKRSLDSWTFDKDSNDTLIYGQWNHNPLAEELLEVMNFSGQSVIDVGCRDGFYCFLAERQGNTVTGIDTDDCEARRFISNHLNSKLVYINENINNLFNWKEKFDVAIVGDVLLHLENPLGVLKTVRNLCLKKIILISDYFPGDESVIEIQNVIHTPYRFRIPSLITMLTLSGFTNIQVNKKLKIENPSSVYNFGTRDIAVITADILPTYKFKPFFCSYYSGRW